MSIILSMFSLAVNTVKEQLINVTTQAPSDSDEIELYKELLVSQTETYNLYAIIFIGIFGVIVLALLIYNFIVSKKQIKVRTEELFKEKSDVLTKKFEDRISKIEAKNKEQQKKEREKLKEKIESDLENESFSLKGEVYYTTAVSLVKTKRYILSVDSAYLFIQALVFYSKGKNTAAHNTFNSVLERLKIIESTIKFCKEFLIHLDSLKTELDYIKNMPEIEEDKKGEFFELIKKIKEKAKLEEGSEDEDF